MFTKAALFLILFTCWLAAQAQQKLEFDGQLSAYINYAPDNELDFLAGGRYIPELSYGIALDSSNTLDFLAAANIYGNTGFHPFDTANASGDIHPYRIWARLTGKQYEFRVGLQKIDFGVATVLRPLQWFNRIDPRDPLAITNGVYGALGRYYFLNNANIWIWALYGNNNTKGYELIPTRHGTVELGGRVQHPVPKGEVGLSYHHRIADSRDINELPSLEKIPEDRYGLDAKWDLGIGLWVEASHIHKAKGMGPLTNQTLINVGVDYTFGLGNGLNVAIEHLIATSDRKAFQFENTNNSTALTMAYPLGFFDNLSAISVYDYESNAFAFFLNYEHQFNKFAGYVMAFYNPTVRAGLIETEIEYSITGPGLRVMVVYNH